MSAHLGVCSESISRSQTSSHIKSSVHVSELSQGLLPPTYGVWRGRRQHWQLFNGRKDRYSRRPFSHGDRTRLSYHVSSFESVRGTVRLPAYRVYLSTWIAVDSHHTQGTLAPCCMKPCKNLAVDKRLFNSLLISFCRAPCKRSPQYRAHQALAPCLQQLPLHTLQRLYQPASHQQLQKMQLIDCKLLDGHFFIAFDELVFHQMIGQGSFKSVFRGRWRNTNVAIVRMRKGGLLTEARLMQKLSTHPNLVQFYRCVH